MIWVHTVCLYAKCKFEKFARRCSRRHKTTFSDADFLGALRVKEYFISMTLLIKKIFLSLILSGSNDLTGRGLNMSK